MVEHLGVAPADQESLKLKDKLVKKGSQTLKGGESHSLRQLHRIRLFSGPTCWQYEASISSDF
jgi:hypothetical protein